jgi:hypothetical protein
MSDKGFCYDIEDEKILEYMKLSDEEKLDWLEEITEFTNSLLNDKEKEFQTALRENKI